MFAILLLLAAAARADDYAEGYTAGREAADQARLGAWSGASLGAGCLTTWIGVAGATGYALAAQPLVPVVEAPTPAWREGYEQAYTVRLRQRRVSRSLGWSALGASLTLAAAVTLAVVAE